MLIFWSESYQWHLMISGIIVFPSFTQRKTNRKHFCLRMPLRWHCNTMIDEMGSPYKTIPLHTAVRQLFLRNHQTRMHLFEFGAELATFFYSNIKLKEWLTRTCCILVAQSRLTLCNPMDSSIPTISVPHQLSKCAQVHVLCLGDTIQPSHPMALHLPSVFPSIRGFSNEWVAYISWQKYWRFSFSVSPPSEYSELISLKIDWFDLLAVKGTLRSFPQHHS